MSGICEGRVVIITGAGRGLGREHALAFAAEGAKVVVNDYGVTGDGREPSSEPANQVAAAIREAGGEAIASGEDVADWEGSGRLVKAAIDAFGGLDVVVNNAGILRDRMFVSSSVDEWDAVLRVHLRGHYCVSRHAAAYWRAEAKAGRLPDARIINTSSGAGLQGSVAQAAYSAAKGGIASLTLVQAAEMGRYGITANAIAPVARTRMTESLFGEMMAEPEDGFDGFHPANVSPLVVWLGSADSADVTGQVFETAGGRISICDGWRTGPFEDIQRRFTPAEVGPAVRRLMGDVIPPQKVWGS